MTATQEILIDLLSGQSTADSIAGRLQLAESNVAAILQRLCKDGHALAGTIAGRLTVYRLTTIGTEAAIAAKPHRRRRHSSPEPAIPS